MEGLLFFWVYPSDGFLFMLISDGNLSHEFPVLDGNPSSNMNSANIICRSIYTVNIPPSIARAFDTLLYPQSGKFDLLNCC